MPKDYIDVVPFRSGRISITFTPTQLAKIEKLAAARRRRAWEWVRMVVLDAIEAGITEAADEAAKRKLLIEEILAEMRDGSRVTTAPHEPAPVVWSGKRSAAPTMPPVALGDAPATSAATNQSEAIQSHPSGTGVDLRTPLPAGTPNPYNL